MLCEACGSDLHVAGTSLLSESMCRLCSRQQTEKQRGTRALHVVNELVTPDVEYESWKEFAGLVYAVQDSYCECVAQATMLAVAQQQFSLVLGRVYGFSPELSHLQERGPGIILRLTKSQGGGGGLFVFNDTITKLNRLDLDHALLLLYSPLSTGGGTPTTLSKTQVD